MTRLGGERPGISTALPASGSDCLLRLSTSYEVRMAFVPPAQTDSSRESMHSGQLERLEAMSRRASERCMERALPELTLGWPPQDSVCIDSIRALSALPPLDHIDQFHDGCSSCRESHRLGKGEVV